MTRLDKPVTRSAVILLDSRVNPRECDHVAVTLYPNGTIGFRAKRSPDEFKLPLATCYRLAISAELQTKKADKAKAKKDRQVMPKTTKAQRLAVRALDECLTELAALRDIEDADECVLTSLKIGRAMMHFRGAIDEDGPKDYDFEDDPEGYQVSILLALMHWSNSTDGKRSFWADLQRAKGMFEDDIAPEVAEDAEEPAPKPTGRIKSWLDPEAQAIVDYVAQGDCDLTCVRCEDCETFDTNDKEQAAYDAHARGWRVNDAEDVLCPKCAKVSEGATL